MTPQTLYLLWGISLALLLVVTAVVAFLLSRVLHSAERILHVTGEIWTAGKLVANNTVHIPLLSTTNRYVAEILATAQQIAAGAGLIAQHAADCPSCPECALVPQPSLGDKLSGLVGKLRKSIGG